MKRNSRRPSSHLVSFGLALILVVMILSTTASPQIQDISIWLEKTTFAPNEEINVHFTAPASFPSNAWIGLIPSNVPHGDETVNDQNDMDYEYISGRTSGVMTFKAPETAGSYDFRMNDNDNSGTEVGHVSFTVSYAVENPTLNLDKRSYVPGEEIRVSFTAPSTYPSNAWVGIIPSYVPHGDEDVNDQYDIDYEYLSGRTSGIIIFTAPTTPGSYDVRMHNKDGGGREVSSISFMVR